MLKKSSLFILFLAFAVALVACGDNSKKGAEANQNILEDKNALSSDLVNNPTSVNDQNVDPNQTGLLVFADTVHDFGTLMEGEVVQYEFDYVNKGSKEVIITSAKGSCGCTVPEYETKPIKPGDTGIMKVTFNSEGRTGYNEKNVQISTNGVPSKYRLTILSTVTKK